MAYMLPFLTTFFFSLFSFLLYPVVYELPKHFVYDFVAH